jgi:hypothetical protein
MECKKCKECFSSMYYYNRHINRKTPCVKEEYDQQKKDEKTCKWCLEEYSRPCTLKIHMGKCKNKIWSKHIGIEIGQTKCLCCKLVEISQLNFYCGHIISEKDDGELTMENIKPICRACNSSTATMNMNEFILKYNF